MGREILYYSGRNIDKKVIDKIKYIANKGYNNYIYQAYFSRLKSVKDLCNLHDTSLGKERLILGKDWFLLYSLDDDYLRMLEWVKDKESKESWEQTREIISELKKLLLKSKNRTIIGDLREDTSYNIYLSAIKRGYIEEKSNRMFLDFCMPKRMSLLLKKSQFNKNVEQFINSGDAKKYEQYHDFVLHRVLFCMSEKFFRLYQINGDVKFYKNKKLIK